MLVGAPDDMTGQAILPGEAPPESDPAAPVDQAAQDGTLATDRTSEPTTDDVRAMVDRWWKKTSETADFTKCVEQAEKDRVVLQGVDPKGGDPEGQKDDQANVTVNHIFRNSTQTVAMCVPAEHSVSWEPRELAEPLPGEPANQQVSQLKRQSRGLGNVMGILVRRYCEEIDIQEKLEAWVQDACHFPIAIRKVMWQGNYATDAISEERLADGQDNLARLSYLLEQFHRGEFSKSDWQWQEITELMASAGKVEVDVRTGILVEEVPVDQWRCDPRVTGPEHVYSAEWMRHDILMQRAEVLSKWAEIDPDDLNSAFTYQLDETGRRMKREEIDRTTNRTRSTVDTAGKRLADSTAVKDTDLMLVAEIYDATTNTVLVLVEGLDYPAAQYAPDRAVEGFFPFVVLVLNRFPGQLAGLSDTQLQANSQTAANKAMAAGENARRSAQPRFAYDNQQIDEASARRIANGEPWELIPLNLGGKDIRQAIMPLAGNHDFNAAEYDPQMHLDNMHRMAALPDQALGVTGVAKFSSEVQTAAAGASILAKYRQNRISRALARLYSMVAQLIMWNVGPDVAVRYAGPLAAQYWPPQVPDRLDIYDSLRIKVKVAIDADLDRAKKAETYAKLFQAAAQLGVRVPASSAAKLFSHALGTEEADDLFQPDPNALVGDLAQTVQQEGLAGMDPKALAMLAQLGSQAMSQMQQLQQQAMAALPGSAQAAAAQVPGQAVTDMPAAGQAVAAKLANNLVTAQVPGAGPAPAGGAPRPGGAAPAPVAPPSPASHP